MIFIAIYNIKEENINKDPANCDFCFPFNKQEIMIMDPNNDSECGLMKLKIAPTISKIIYVIIPSNPICSSKRVNI